MKKKILPVFIVILLILIIGGVYAARIIQEKYAYSKERADMAAWLGAESEEEIPVILNRERTDVRARRYDGVDYLRYEDVCALLTKRLYYGQADGILCYVLPQAIMRMEIGADSWQADDGSSGTEEVPISRMEGETLYIALPFLTNLVDFEWASYEEPAYVNLRTAYTEETVATITANTQLRLRGGIKSEIMEDLAAGEQVTILEEMETWTKVATGRGFTGYVENKRLKDLADIVPQAPRTAMATDEEYAGIHRDYRINMGFHAVFGVAGNDTLESYVSQTRGMNVIAPTWFMIAGEDGSIRDVAASDYAARAHAMGLEVWGVVDNFNGVAAEVSTEAVLSHEESRRNLISALIARAQELGIDGINVDFEQIQSSYASSYVEFLRELSVACRRNGLVCSVDDPVPFDFNSYYDLREQGIMLDYVVIMGYDEHYAGSTEAGSVASIGYVENGVARATREAPPSKVVLALPFYTRVWRTAKDGSLSSEALPMTVAQEFIRNHGLTEKWDEETCQNYYEYTDKKETLVQIWNEDAMSIETKLSVSSGYGIGGYAAWELGYETPDIWDVILPYVKG
ncbi:MAG: chitinase [Butyrivibrio sp.]|nr:chitinase [Butyrivibrio sp.]